MDSVYAPNGNADSPIPGGQTWVKGSSVGVRSHELSHNFGMLHSSRYTQTGRKFLGATLKPGGWCPAADGFSEYGDPRCVMGGGSSFFNAPQRLIHGWITTDPQFASSKIFPAGTLSSPPVSDHAICVFSSSDMLADFAEHRKFQVRQLDFDPQASAVWVIARLPCQGGA